MVDPVSGGIGKASQQMMQELQKQMSEQVQGGEGPEKAKFNDLMVQDVQQNQDLTKTQGVNDPTRAQSVLKTAQVNATQKVDGKNIDIKGVEADSSARTGLKKMLNKMVEGQNKLDDIIKMATSGKQYGQQELLAIQASVYKFSQELDLTSKVVEKATSGIKQTMQTQV